MRHQDGLMLLLISLATPSQAQDIRPDWRSGAVVSDDLQSAPAPPPTPLTRSGEVAQTSVGQAGQRQTRDQISRETGIEPMARISMRVQNRVQNRLRNRIDRFYNPQANATEPFTIAGEQVRIPQRR